MYDYSAPQVGDFVFARLPLHTSPKNPGPQNRLCLVLGLEVDETNHSLEGLWLIRLSERIEKIRSWDYVLRMEEMRNVDIPALAQDYVIRTPRIDLIPTTADFMDDLSVHGHVIPTFWDDFLPQLHEGQLSDFEGSFGPRRKYEHTVVKTSVDADDCFATFDYESILSSVSLPDLKEMRTRTDRYAMALRQQRCQCQSLSQVIHDDFRRAGENWNWAEYRQTVLPQRLAELRLV